MSGHYLRNDVYKDLYKDFPVPKAFRESEPQHRGFMAPVRFEGSITDLEIIGDVPETISGTFYRVMPEPHYPSFIENDPVKSIPSPEALGSLIDISCSGLTEMES